MPDSRTKPADLPTPVRADQSRDVAKIPSGWRQLEFTGVAGADDTPWEPPLAGTEVEQLLGGLRLLSTTFRWKAAGLDGAGLHSRSGVSTLTLGGLLKHLALVEDNSFGPKLDGAPLGPPWNEVDWESDPDWEIHSASEDTPSQLYALWDDAVGRSRTRLGEALIRGGL